MTAKLMHERCQTSSWCLDQLSALRAAAELGRSELLGWADCLQGCAWGQQGSWTWPRCLTHSQNDHAGGAALWGCAAPWPGVVRGHHCHPLAQDPQHHDSLDTHQTAAHSSYMSNTVRTASWLKHLQKYRGGCQVAACSRLCCASLNAGR